MIPKTFAVALVLLAGPALAQESNPGNLAPDTPAQDGGSPAEDRAGSHDQNVAQLLAAGGMAEVEFARLALDKSASDDIRGFAEMMVADHGKANDQLAEVAADADIPLPDGLDAEHQAMMDRLQELEGEEFDLAYIRGQITDHQKTVQLLSSEVGSGQEGDLQRLAAELLPVVQGHLDRAQEIHAGLSGAR